MKDHKYDDRLQRMMDKMRKKAPLDPNDEYYFRYMDQAIRKPLNAYIRLMLFSIFSYY
jgi:hypothetical protein